MACSHFSKRLARCTLALANNMILKTSLSGLINHAHAGGLNTTVIKINGPDLLTIDSNGTLYTKCNSTAVCRISPDNSVAVIANDFENARGVTSLTVS